ncbi:MAG: right-handed parallel beta-helix repeat-containing protein [Phycisphaerae bacterium]|nr:right-handed parallel beta-helix repeat-containing protein [Phycisphaerae bacterium]
MRAKTLSNLIILLFTAALASAATRHVPDQYPNIQAAIDDCNDGDTVIIAPGTYTGPGNRDIDFKGKPITVRSTDPNDPQIVASTVIDCQNAGRGFHFANGEERDSILEGLTITNGSARGRLGGGIFCDHSSPTTRYCRIRQCTAWVGGGICLQFANATVINCTVTANYASSKGGGIHLRSGTNVISNCLIADNSVLWRGGGLNATDGNLSIANCVIAHNSAASSNGGGGGLFFTGGTQTITNCSIANNSTKLTGGAILCDTSTPIIVNSIFWGNTASSLANMHPGTLVSYSNVQGGYSGTGNIGADPLFIDPGVGNYHLSAGSPCIDAGDPAYGPAPEETDMDGEPRHVGARVDIGADELPSDALAIGVFPTVVRSNNFQGTATPPAETVQIWNTGLGTLNWRITEDCPWLQVNPQVGTSTNEPNQVTLTVETVGLHWGTYNCQLTVADPCALNNPRTVEIILDLVGPEIESSAAHIDFSAYEGGAVPAQKTFTIRNSGGSLLSWQISGDCDWLDVNPTAGNSTGDSNEITLTVDTAGLHWGAYNCLLTISDPCAMNSPQVIDVALDVIGPEIEVSPTNIEFSGYMGDAVLPQQAFTIRNDGGGLLSWQVGTDCDWLDLAPTAGTSRGEANEIILMADVSTLPWGSYDCNLTVSDPNASNSPVILPVSLDLVGPLLSVNSNLFDFEAGKEKPTPPGQILSIQNTGGGTLDWRIIAPNDCNWLSIDLLTGQSADEVNEVTLSVDAAGLEYGSHSCQLTVTDPNAQHGLETIDVTLTLPAPVISAEPTALQIHTWQTGPCLIERTLSIRNMGGDTVNWAIYVPNGCSWLSVDPLSGRSAGDVNEVTLFIDTTGVADGFYSCDLAITDPNAANSPRTIKVYLYMGFEEGLLLVPSEFTTIQSAIDWALPGDVVVVAPGTYTGPGNRNISFLGKPITVRSMDPNDPAVVAATVIDCNAATGDHHRGFNFKTGEDANSILAGLTITNGYANNGAAIYFARSGEGPRDGPTTDPVECRILNCIITNNTAQYDGGGCYITRGNPTISNCIITGNSAGEGGAICCSESNAVITNCTITGNQCLGGARGSYGGGIYLSHGSLMITYSTISHNKAIDYGSGGGIYLYRSNATIGNCIFTGNSADSSGAIGCSKSDVHISNCTFAGNSAGSGSAIAELGSASTVTNSIFWKNTPSEIYATYDGTLAITYCNIRDAFGGVGNIDLHPLFVDPGYWDSNGTASDIEDDSWVDGDYHLKSEGWRWDTQRGVWTWDDVTSRCIDAGDPYSPLGDELLAVPADPNNDWGENLRINMGAFGGTQEASIPPHSWTIREDYNNDGIFNFTDFAFWSQNHGYSAAESPAEPNSAPALNAAELALFADRWLDQTTWFGTLPPPPAAWNPNPPNAAIGVNMHPMLTWQSGTGAASHDVYFGPTDPPAFQANQTETTFYPDYLSEETTYYWRIDEVNPDGTTTGPVWRFTTGTGGSVRCFPAETIVWVDGEMTEICKVSAGSMVDKPAVIQTIAGMRKAVCGHEIEGVDVHDECRTWDRYDITLENGNSLAVADSHYFLLYSGKWLSVENLASGSELATLEGSVTIKKVEKSTSSGAVYNLRIKDGQRYLVGKDGIIVRDW